MIAEPAAPDSADLGTVFAAAALAVDDLSEAGRSFFRFTLATAAGESGLWASPMKGRDPAPVILRTTGATAPCVANGE